MVTPFQIKRHFELLSTRRNKRTYILKEGLQAWCNDKYPFSELIVDVKKGTQVLFDDAEERYVIISEGAEFKFYKVATDEAQAISMS